MSQSVLSTGRFLQIVGKKEGSVRVSALSRSDRSFRTIVSSRLEASIRRLFTLYFVDGLKLIEFNSIKLAVVFLSRSKVNYTIQKSTCFRHKSDFA